MPTLAPVPLVGLESWRALISAAYEFAALKPWEFARDSDAVGLIDPVTGEIRISHVLGNAGETFAAVFYRRAGLQWILSRLGALFDPEDFSNADGMDCLKVEFICKSKLRKEDLAVLNAASFAPTGKSSASPEFRLCEPGWHPWFINQREADRLLTDLLRLTAFCKLFGQSPGLFDGHAPTEIPFLPATLPGRPLTRGDLHWRPLVPPPIPALEPFRAPAGLLETLRTLKYKRGLSCEFDCTMALGGSIYDNGRPCFGRFSLLVETRRGVVVGTDVQSGALNLGEAAGSSLIKVLLTGKMLPNEIFIRGSRLQPALQPLCDELQIQLQPVSSLPLLEEALESVKCQMASSPARL